MKKTFAAVLAALCVCGAAAATTQEDCTAYMTASDTGYNNSSFNHGAHWSDGNIPGEGSTNYVGAGFKVMDSYVNSGTLYYPGDVLVLAGTFAGQTSGGATISWPELRLENGALYTWSSFHRVAGKVVVESDETAPAVLRMFYPGNYNGATLAAQFFGGPDACLMLARNSGTPSVVLPDLRWTIAGDWSQFYGTCIVSNRSQFVPYLANAVYPGTIVIDEGGYWWGYYNFGSTTVTVGTLDLRDGSHFWGKWNSSGGSSLTVVTNELKIGATEFAFWDTWTTTKTPSTFPNYTVGGNPVKIPLFKLTGAAAGKVPDLTRATIPDYPAAKKSGEFPRLKALVCEENGDGTKTISVKYYDDDGIIIMNKGNGSYKYAESAFNPDNDASLYWSTGEIPTSETSGDVYASQSILWAGSNTYSYPDLTYTFASTLYMQCDSLTAKKFIFATGSGINTYSHGKTKHMYGPIELMASNATHVISVFQNFSLNIHGDISGAGGIRVTSPSPHTSPVGYTTFTGSHAGMHGAFCVTCTANYDSSKGAILPDLANKRYVNVTVERGDQFGGEYWGDNPWKSIWINNYGCIHMTAADITVNEPTRALFVEGGAQFDVGEGRTCTLDIPITFGGELLKIGAGTLSLGGSARFIDGNPATEPLEGTNRLTIAAGSLRVTSTNAVNGVRVAFGEGTSLIVDPEPADEGLADVGIVNTRWSEPFVSTRADGRIPVTFKTGSQTLESGVGSYSVALCTVPSSAAEGVRAMLKLLNVPHYRTEVKPRTNDDGSVTLLAAFTRKGLAISFR